MLLDALRPLRLTLEGAAATDLRARVAARAFGAADKVRRTALIGRVLTRHLTRRASRGRAPSVDARLIGRTTDTVAAHGSRDPAERVAARLAVGALSVHAARSRAAAFVAAQRPIAADAAPAGGLQASVALGTTGLPADEIARAADLIAQRVLVHIPSQHPPAQKIWPFGQQRLHAAARRSGAPYSRRTRSTRRPSGSRPGRGTHRRRRSSLSGPRADRIPCRRGGFAR